MVSIFTSTRSSGRARHHQTISSATNVAAVNAPACAPNGAAASADVWDDDDVVAMPVIAHVDGVHRPILTDFTEYYPWSAMVTQPLKRAEWIDDPRAHKARDAEWDKLARQGVCDFASVR